MDKPFALFVGDDFYPAGGWLDFVGCFGTGDEAVAAAAEPEADCVSGWWFHVADLRTGEVVAGASGLSTRWRPEGDPNDPNILIGDEEDLASPGKPLGVKGI
jgi:hypothetical protein